jgi:carboxyl-terminal processing protease
LLETAKEMLGRFVDDKVVVRMKMRGDAEEVHNTPSGEVHNFTYPIVVLVNEDSASASEIFSGVLRDYKKATLVGEHTYGKECVQEVKAFRDGASAKITIARYYLPGGQDFSRKVDDDGQYLSGGIEPDVKVDLDLDKITTYGDLKTDNQLQKAIEVLKSKL